MLDYTLNFDSPWYLLLLGVLPLLWWLARQTLAALGPARRGAALVLRMLVVVLVICALAEMQLVRTSDRLTVIYLLDQSLSIPVEHRREMLELVNASIQTHLDRQRADRAGVIGFGREALVEIPPVGEVPQLVGPLETLPDPEYTDLASAMKLAMALFPPDSAKRIVILSDGNENRGDARSQAEALADAGIGIDVLPVELVAQSDVAVEKLAVSSSVKRGQPFDLRVVLNNRATEGDRVVRGQLTLLRQTAGQEEVLAVQPLELSPGKQVFTTSEQLDTPDFYTYEARFTPDNPAEDALPQNNRATAFTHVHGRGHVLVIEDWANPGKFQRLVERLRSENLDVTVQGSDHLFASLAELQRYDTVLMADVPRSSGHDAEQITSFSDAQIEMLTRNTQQLGGGLVMIGGPNSFGVGGWANTEIEKAMPVDFHVKNLQVEMSGALLLVIDRSGSMAGDKLEMAKAAVLAAVQVLGPNDRVGVVAFDSQPEWVVPFQHVRSRRVISWLVSRLAPQGGTDLEPAMQLGYEPLTKAVAAIKHMIVLTDGQTPPGDMVELARKMRALSITTTGVAVGEDAAAELIRSIALAGGGKYYNVRTPDLIPKIFMREARRVASPLVYENPQGLTPRVYPHEVLKGIDPHLPPITGFVRTTKKDSPLVEVAMVSPKPEERHATLLATWTYGLGKTVALTTDAGQRWASSWTGWEHYDQLFSQIVRWSMRPVTNSGKFTVATDVKEGQGELVITALDEQDGFVNFLNLSGAVVGPNLRPVDVEIRQLAPGRYVGKFDAKDPGNYLILVNSGTGEAPLRTGVNVPYSDEFRDRQTNRQLLDSLAALTPENGQPGTLVDLARLDPKQLEASGFNPFRRDLPPGSASQDVWHWLVLAGMLLFFGDVFNRRVTINLRWALPILERARNKLLRRETVPVASATLERLRSSKAALDVQIDERRAAVRFEPAANAQVDLDVLEPEPATTAATPARPASRAPVTPAPLVDEPESYTQRLLKAKKQVWQDKQ